MVRILFAAAIVWIIAHPAYAQDAPCPKAPDPTLHPIVGTHTVPPYPSLSVANNEEGITELEVLIGTDGKVVSDKVIASSGSLRLDAAAADFVKENWQWEPMIFNCKPVQVPTRVSIHWDIRYAPVSDQRPKVGTIIASKSDYPPDALERREQGWTLIVFYVVADGSMVFPTVLRSSGFADLNAKAFDVAKTHNWMPGTMDGKPVFTVMEVLVEWTLDGTPPPQ